MDFEVVELDLWDLEEEMVEEVFFGLFPPAILRV